MTRTRPPPEPTTMSAMLCERGYVACRCGDQFKRAAGPWECSSPKCGKTSAGGATEARPGPNGKVVGSTPTRQTTSHPAPSKPAGRAAEDAMAAMLEGAGHSNIADLSSVFGFDVFVRQFAWALAQGRGFAFDFAWPAIKVALEVVGGAHAAGRAKVKADVERSGLAASLGWRVVTVTPEQVKDGTALALVRAATKGGA